MRNVNPNSKTCIMKFRCTPEQEKIIKTKAEKARVPVSEFLLKSTLKSRTRISSASRDMTRSITQCQTDLNRLIIGIQCAAKTGELDGDALLKTVMTVQDGMDEIWRLLR